MPSESGRDLSSMLMKDQKLELRKGDEEVKVGFFL